jgi:hypothetical protein
MTPKKPVPDMIRGGHRFPKYIMLKKIRVLFALRGHPRYAA